VSFSICPCPVTGGCSQTQAETKGKYLSLFLKGKILQIRSPHKKFLSPDLGNRIRTPFLLFLVKLVDPDHVRIRNYMHFGFWWIFWRVRIRGSGSGFASYSGITFLSTDSGNRIRTHSHYFSFNSRIRITSGSGIICISGFDEFFDGSGSGFAFHSSIKFLSPDSEIRIRTHLHYL
jgi:hypothetical protein